MGPFGREGIQYKHIKTRWTGRFLVEENGYKIMQVLAQCGVLSKTQAISLSGCGRNGRGLFPRLVDKGYLDCYEALGAPNLYSLSEKGAEEMNVRYQTWDTTGLQRLAAANQFWLRVKEVWPDTEWDTTGEIPALTNKGVVFNVLAPRTGYIDRLLALKQLNKCEVRVFIVAANKDIALEIALNCPPGRMARYTWDAQLKDGLNIYYLAGGGLVLDKNIAKAG